MSDPKSEKKVPFVQWGNDRTDVGFEYERALVGDKEGLEYLRTKIDDALANGDEVLMSDKTVHTDLTHVKIAKLVVAPPQESKMGEWPSILGCFALFAAVVTVFIIGLIQVIKWLIQL